MSEVMERPRAEERSGAGAIRWGVAIDLKRCTGCQSCTVACKAENGTPPGVFWTRVVEKEEGTFPFAYKVFMPVRCNHCSDPPCVPVCPTGASYVREKDNLVLIDQDKCIGCGTCVVACPYDVRFLPESARGYYGAPTPYERAAYQKWQKGTVQKCTLCVHRLDAGLEPACIATCPTKALTFGDLNDPRSEISRLVRERPHFRPSAELGTDPNVFYLT
jgi:molybdopterin-containing oxidoreductase family iron-sulfur binding subunit